MRIEEFKTKMGLKAISFTNKSENGRLTSFALAVVVGKTSDGKNTYSGLIFTSEGFDSSKPAYIYEDRERNCYWVSNKEGAPELLSL